MKQVAIDVLKKNWTGKFTKPAPSLYPHQWNWDAGFIALGCAHFDMARAEAELRHLFSGQWANGMLPQIVFGEERGARYFPGPDFWQTASSPHAPRAPLTSGITMPPVHGFVLWRLFLLAADKDRAQAFLAEMYPKVLALHRYLYTCRDPRDEGLVYIQHPWESGTDNSPTWDAVLARLDPAGLDIPPYERQDLQNPKAALHRPSDLDYDRYVYLVDLFRRHRYHDGAIYRESPFLVQDPLFNGILAWSNECLIHIGDLLGEDVLEPMLWHERTIYALNEKLWDEERGIYNAYDLRADQLIPVNTSSGLMPMAGGVPTQEQAESLLEHLENGNFGSAGGAHYLCPTYWLEAPDFDNARYWRGPVWVNMNWMLFQGLLRYDMTDAAARLRHDTLQLVERYGYFEYFDPSRYAKGPAGYGTDQFSWTAALYLDLLASEVIEEEE